jgi:hypothetical protein
VFFKYGKVKPQRSADLRFFRRRRSGVRQLAAAFLQASLLACTMFRAEMTASKLAAEKRQQAAALQTP